MIDKKLFEEIDKILEEFKKELKKEIGEIIRSELNELKDTISNNLSNKNKEKDELKSIITTNLSQRNRKIYNKEKTNQTWEINKGKENIEKNDIDIETKALKNAIEKFWDEYWEKERKKLYNDYDWGDDYSDMELGINRAKPAKPGPWY